MNDVNHSHSFHNIVTFELLNLLPFSSLKIEDILKDDRCYYNKVRGPRIRSAHIPADPYFCGQP